MSNQETFDWDDYLNTRAAELAQMPAQQLLGRIAALLEAVFQSQFAVSSNIIQALHDVEVTGTVDVGNSVDVVVQNDSPIEVSISHF